MGFGLKGIATQIRMWLSDGAAAAVSAADEFTMRYNTAAQRAEYSQNTGPYVSLVSVTELVFADIAAMGAYEDAFLPNATACEVATLLCSWELVRLSAVAPDGITVVATHSGAGRWHRRDNLGNTWTFRSTWTIDFAAGNDENFGDVVAPLKTHDELVRRIGCHLGEGAATITIDFVGDYTGNIDWAGSRTEGDVSLVYVGVRTTLYVGTVTANVVYNPATNTIGAITDAALGTTWTLAGYVGKAIVVDTGPFAGYVGWIEVDTEPLTGAHSAEYHIPVDVATWAIGDPVTGNGYEIVSFTKVTGFMRFAGRMSVTVSDINIVGAGGFANCFTAQGPCYVAMNTCLFESGMVYTGDTCVVDFVGCRLASTVGSLAAYGTSTIYLDCCALECPLVSESPVTPGFNGGIQIYTATTSWNKGALTRAGSGSIIVGSGTWWGAFYFPAGSVGLLVDRGQSASLIGLFWGVHNLGNYGISCVPPSTVRYDTLPTFGPNAIQSCLIAGLACAYADLPAVVPVKMTGIVKYP